MTSSTHQESLETPQDPLDLGDIYEGDDAVAIDPISSTRLAPRPEIVQLLAEAEQAASETSIEPVKAAIKRVPKPQEQPIPIWGTALAAALGVAVVENGLKLFGVETPIYYRFLPYEFLPLLPIRVWLGFVPFAWPALAAVGATVARMLTAGPQLAQTTCVLAGFAWDRNSFCRGWLCTGATGSGKSLGPNVDVLMFDGTTKKAKDVEVDDLLMGPDSTARRVLAAHHGKCAMYRITPRKGEPWECNDVHMMTLKYSPKLATRPSRSVKGKQVYQHRCAFDPFKDEIFALRESGKTYRAIGELMSTRPGVFGCVKSDKMAILDYIRRHSRRPESCVKVYKSCPTARRGGLFQAFGVDLAHTTAAGKRHFHQEFWNEVVDVQLDEFLKRTPAYAKKNFNISTYWKMFRVGVEFDQAANPKGNEFSEDWFYFAGLWLGDGRTLRSEITAVDEPVIDFLRNFATSNGFNVTVRGDARSPHVKTVTLFADMERGNDGRFQGAPETTPYRRLLHECVDEAGCKQLPHWFLTAPRDKRLALLAGIIDSDGHYSGGTFEVTFSIKKLSEQLQFLCRSLGLHASLGLKHASIRSGKYAGFEGTAWRVTISGNLDVVPVLLPRKKAPARLQRKDPLVFGWKAEPIGEGDYYGFMIDGDGRFLLGDFTVTHNTVSGINPLAHQVFQREAGIEKPLWADSALETKTLACQQQYKADTEPAFEQIGALEKNIAGLLKQREKLFQNALAAEIDGSINTARASQQLRAYENNLTNLMEERTRLLESSEAIEEKQIKELEDQIRGMGKLCEDLKDRPWLASPNSKAAQELIECDDKITEMRRKAEQIEDDEIRPRRMNLNATLKRIEQARYDGFPWGGLCIDEKGLYWQTMLKMARHYDREHHLMLLQTRPDWAPDNWVPPARFNLLSDDAIPANTYAKALVDTATQVAGGEGDKGFFKTQAESNIGWAIELDRAIRAAEITLGIPPDKATMPSIKNCLHILSAQKNFTAYLTLKGCTATSEKTNGVTVEEPARLSSGKLRIAIDHFNSRYWSQPKDQLGGVIGTIYNYLNYFSGDEVAEVFCADNTFEFKGIDMGMILMVAMPQKLAVERRYVCTLLKLLFYQHVLRRFGLNEKDKAWTNRNLLICWQDEAQRFVTIDDGNVDVIREAGATTVMACQSKISLYPPLGGKDKAQVTILNLRNRIVFTAADDECATASADFLGKVEKKKKSYSTSRSGTSYSYQTEDVHRIKPHQFRALPKYVAIVCHADGKFVRALLPPINTEGNLPTWFQEPFTWKLKRLVGIKPF